MSIRTGSAPGSSIDSSPEAFQRRTMAKVYWRTVPLICVGYIVSYLDRVNIGVASLTMNKALGLSPSQFGFIAGIFFIGYFLAEVPSNLILQRVGPRKWMTRILVTWGLISGATAFVQGPTSFALMRFLLGLAEAGFVPGVFLYFATWFPSQYRGRAVAGFILGLPIANLFGSPISSSLLALDGMSGLAGWQWLLILEAAPAVILGAVYFFLLHDNPETVTWLSPEERHWLTGTLAAERKSIEAVNATSLRSAFTNGRILAFSLVLFLFIVGSFGVALWMPQIIRGYGFSVVQVGFIVAIPYLCAATVVTRYGYYSDKSPHRARYPISALLFACLGLILAAALSRSAILEILALTMTFVGTICFQGTFWPLPMSILSGRAAAGGYAIITSIGNLGGFAGPFLIGEVKQYTGSFDGALLALAGLILLAAVLLLTISRNASHVSRDMLREQHP